VRVMASEPVTLGRLPPDMSVLITYFTIAPVRVITAGLAVCLVLLGRMTLVLMETNFQRHELCGLTIAVLEAVVTMAVLWVWEDQRRAVFAAQRQLEERTAAQAALATMLVDIVAAYDPCLPQGAASAETLTERGSPSEIAAVMVVSLHTAGGASDTHSTRLDALEAVISCASTHLTPANNITMICQSASTVCIACSDAHIACSFANLLFRSFEHMSDIEVRIGIDLGSINTARTSLKPSVLVPRVVTVGQPVGSALRLAQLAVSGTALVSDACRTAVSLRYQVTRVHSTLIQGQLTELHLLGRALPSTLTHEAPPPAHHNVFCDGESGEPFSRLGLRLQVGAGVGASLPAHAELTTTLQSSSSVASDALGMPEAGITLEWSWLFGFHFSAFEAEAIFREQECGGRHRFVSAVVCLLFTLAWAGWVVGFDYTMLDAWCWAGVAVAVLCSVGLFAVASPCRVSQLRAAFLYITCHLLLKAVPIFVVYGLSDVTSPFARYLEDYIFIASAVPVLWYPTALPAILGAFVQIGLYLVLVNTVRVSNASPVAVPLILALTAVGRVQLVRLRRRQAFAAVLNAERFMRHWLDVRAEATHRLSTYLPQPVAARIVQLSIGEASDSVHSDSSHDTDSDLELMELNRTPRWPDSSLCCTGVVVAFRHPSVAGGSHDGTPAAGYTAIVDEMSALADPSTCVVTGPDCLLLLVLHTADEDAAHESLIAQNAALAQRIYTTYSQASGVAPLVGIGRGVVVGRLIGEASWCSYAVDGPAVIRAVRSIRRCDPVQLSRLVRAQ
jgi:class 3 adenylate cyclase